MLDKRMLMLSAATAICALSLGFVMQPDSAPSGGGASEREHLAEGAPETPGELDLSLTNISLTSALPQLEGPSKPVSPSIASRAEVQLGCEMAAEAVALPGAMVSLQITAPCLRDERVTIHHQGMMFTETLDGLGALDLQVPALARTAVFIVDARSRDSAEAEGSGAVSGGALAVVDVPDLDQVDRVVLQWRGNSGFEVHAREFGANYNEEGHLWREAPDHGLGQVLMLGDPDQLSPRLVETYSFQRGGETQDGEIEISVEAQVTEINCGREISAQSLRLTAGRIISRDLVLEMPDCSATGDFLVLNNLVENLKIAAK